MVLAKAGQTEAVFQQLQHFLVSCSGRTSNFRLIANHQHLFLFSSSGSRAGRNSISQPSPIPLRYRPFYYDTSRA
jgi:hypothetical protein